MLDDATSEMKEGDQLDGETAFKLYDTYGFPLDLTQEALRSRGITVDTDAFDAAMERQKEGSNCLLYTSPSPRDQRGSRMPSSA